MRIARRAVGESTRVPITVLAVVLVVLAWVFINGWYLVWGIWLIPYRCCAGCAQAQAGGYAPSRADGNDPGLGGRIGGSHRRSDRSDPATAG